MNYARAAHEIGVQFIGGCCGFEPYHIRAMAEELAGERGGRLPEVSKELGLIVDGLKKNVRGHIQERCVSMFWSFYCVCCGGGIEGRTGAGACRGSLG